MMPNTRAPSSVQKDAEPILWVNHFAVPPDQGGGTRHFELGRELARFGWSVHIAASDFNYVSRRYMRRASEADHSAMGELVDGVQFLWLWSAAYQRNDWRRARNWITFARTVWNLERQSIQRPSVVIGSSPHLFAALAAERLANRLRVPFVLEVRDLWPESIVAGGGRKGPLYYLLERIAQFLYRRAARIVVLARGSADHIARMGHDPRKMVYVPNGVDVAGFAHTRRRSGPKFTLVYAGAHGPMNGLDVVLDAAELLRHRNDIHILLVGDGPSKQSLVDSAITRGLSNVEFRSPVPKSEMPALLASVDAGLMVLRETPLFAYGVSPNKLFDYLGAALPVVCNVPGDVARMLREAQAGEQAENGSAQALAKAIAVLAERSVESRTQLGESGRAWVLREHDRPVLAGRVDKMLRELLTS